jgi:hypothetical protein
VPFTLLQAVPSHLSTLAQARADADRYPIRQALEATHGYIIDAAA